MRGCLLLTLSLAACGRVGFDRVAPSGDGAPDGEVAPRCDPATPFETPVEVPGLNDAAAYDSTFTPLPDELTGYFYSDRNGNYDLYFAARTDLAARFTINQVAELASTSVDKEPAPSDDGRFLAFVSSRPPADSGGDLYGAAFDGSTFTMIGPITSLSTPSTDYHPFFQIGSDDFYFSSNRTGAFAIYRSTYLGNGAFGAPMQLTDLDVSGSDTEVAIVAEGGLVMYFRSDRPGSQDLDIWRATRASTTDRWGDVTNVTEVNSSVLDTPGWISPDLCRLYLSSSRLGRSDIFMASRSP